jgi:UDP-glucose 4-epimerase
LFNVYGPNDLTPHFIPSILKRINKSNSIKAGNLDTIRDYIYIDDIINVLLKIIKEWKTNNNIYNIGTGKGTAGNKIIKLIEKIKGAGIKIDSDAGLIRKIDRRKLVANIQKLSADYNWSPKYDINHGLKKLIKKDE